MEQLALPMRAPAMRPPEPESIREAVFSDDGKIRWVLKECWRAGPAVLWCGVNPSWASKDRNDMTILRVRHFTRLWGYGSWIMVNQYPLVTSDPAQCRRAIQALRSGGGLFDLYDRNLEIIAEQLRAVDIAVACWGASAWDPDHTEDICDALQAIEWHERGSVGERPIYCLGTNGDGSPRHPMSRGRNRVPDDQQPVVWSRPERDESY